MLIRFFNGSGRDRSDLWPELIKQRRYCGSRCAAFVAFEQRVVGFVGITPEFGLFAGDFQQLLEMRRECIEVGFFAGLGPCVLGERCGGRFASYECGRQFRCAFKLPAELAQVGAEFGITAGVAVFRILEISTPLIAGGHFVGTRGKP